MSSHADDNWCTVPAKKNNKAERDAAKAEKAAEAARQAALKAAERPVPKNKGTVVCRNFLSPEGCKRGDLCNFRHSHDAPSAPSNSQSSWRRTTTTARPPAAGEEEDGTVHDRFHPFLSPAMRERVERASKMEIPAEHLSALPDIDFAPNPLEKVILASLYCNAVTPAFETSFQQAEANFVNMQVGSHLHFPEETARPSLIDFSPEQLTQLTQFLLSERSIADVAALGGIFTWAEGDFRQKTIPQFHGNLRVCKFKLLESEPAARTPLMEALLHTYEYTLADMFYDVHAQAESDLSQTTFLNVRRRLTPEGKESDVFLVRREIDGMQLGLWDSLKSQHFNTLWFPFSRAGFRKSIGSPGSWFKLRTEDHPEDERYFHLFGFDDRESKKIAEIESIAEKAAHKNAKFLRFVEETSATAFGDKKHSVKRRIKATKNRAEASKFFQDGVDGVLYLVQGSGEKETKQLVKCPLVRKRNLEDVDHSPNPYFREDLQALSQLPTDAVHWNRKQDVDLSLEQLGDLVLIHPFLPIVAFKRPAGENTTKQTLERLQLLLKGLRDPETNHCPDCEVILYLSSLRSHAEEDLVKLAAIGPAGNIVSGKHLSTAIPGLDAADFPAEDLEEWKQVVGYTWLLPAVFFQSGLLPQEKLREWLAKFEEKGEKFKVVS